MDNPFKKMTLPRRIMLHLLWFNVDQGEYVMPVGVTQQGISEAVGVRRSQVSSALKNLLEEGMVSESLAHITNCSRRMKAYILTQQGREVAKDVRNSISGIQLDIRKDGTTSQKSIADIVSDTGLSHMVISRSLDEHGEVNLDKKDKEQEDTNIYAENLPVRGLFVGRTKELAQLSEWMEISSSGTMAVHGLAGIGKTSLMREFVEKQSSVFWFSGETWTTNRSFLRSLGEYLKSKKLPRLSIMLEKGHVDMTMALEALSEAKGPKLLVLDECHLLPDTIDIAGFMIKASALEGNHVLLADRILPDAYDRRDVSVTGKVKELELSTLEKEDCLSLLEKKGMVEGAENIVQAAGGHPLALELAAAHPERPMGDVVSFFRDEVLSSISDKEREMLALASIFRHFAPLEALFTGGGAYKDLDTLLNSSLLFEVEEGYSMQGVLREVLAQRITPSEKKKYHLFAAEFYDRERRSNGTILVEDVLEAVYHYGEAHLSPEAARIMLETGRDFLSCGFQYEALESISQMDKSGLSENSMYGLTALTGLLLVFIGKTKEAKIMLEGVLKRIPSSSPEKAKALNSMGIAEYKEGDLDRAMETYTAALVEAEKIDDKDQMAWAIGHMAVIHADRGMLDLALIAHQMDMGISETINDKKGMARAFNNMAIIHHKEKRYQEALVMFQKCRDLALDAGNMHIATIALNNIGDNYRCMDDKENSVEYFKQGLKSARSHRYPWEEAEALFYLGQLTEGEVGKEMLSLSADIYHHMGDEAKAREAEELLG